ncbi:MAG TPA: PIG-L family deacetylase [Usitatibacter sp.]|nr:PIG-L family deacetylase [Usitatibacter sp.]
MTAIPQRLLVISPHLDDAVFGCSALLMAHPGAWVATVFAGVPGADVPLPEWDATCGFASAREAMLARREEDRAALALLGARSEWLDFPDAQYRDRRPQPGVADAIAAAIERARPRLVAIPAGLFHDDHKAAHEAALEALRAHGAVRWLFYEDALYRRIEGLLGARLERLAEAGFVARRLPRAPFDAGRKRAAVERYASQLRGLASGGRPGHRDLALAERYWSLTPWRRRPWSSSRTTAARSS